MNSSNPNNKTPKPPKSLNQAVEDLYILDDLIEETKALTESEVELLREFIQSMETQTITTIKGIGPIGQGHLNSAIYGMKLSLAHFQVYQNLKRNGNETH